MKRSIILLLNLTYWLIYCLLLGIFYVLLAATVVKTGAEVPNFGFEWLKLVLGLAVVPGVIGFYSGYLWLYPRFLVTRQLGKLAVSGAGISLLASLSGLAVLLILSEARISFSFDYQLLIIIGVIAFITLINIVIGLMLRGFITSYNDIRLKEELGRKNHQMEMELIKAQLDPHFLFNTINNIDILIGMDTEKASLFLRKLSDIMRFVLYEAKTERIALTADIEHMGKYFELQQIRSSNAGYAVFEVSGPVEEWSVQPMLFMPFIENAFKHTENRRENETIRVVIRAGAQLEFECRNRYVENTTNELTYGGLGIGLIRKRLELLYPDTHQLEITRFEGIFTVKLSISR
ncbi:MAG: histidine kinase [Bacteroidota bacterium]